MKNQKDSRNQPRLNVKLRGAFNQTDPERKEKPEEKIFTFAVSNNLKYYSLEDHMSSTILSYMKKLSMTNSWADLFFQVQVSRHLIFYA